MKKILINFTIFAYLISCSRKAKELQMLKNSNTYYNKDSITKYNKNKNNYSKSWFSNSNSTFKKLLTTYSLFSLFNTTKSETENGDILLCKLKYRPSEDGGIIILTVSRNKL
ncbi:MAG: hypothetical protein GY830_02695 [Bacteroidetes bacterium]|nr:hypothetical protein [Bacteroidota bacterium]